MRTPHPIRTAAVILALGLPDAASALRSPEPTDGMDSGTLSVVLTSPAVAHGPQVPLGYTPPLDDRKLDSAIKEGSGAPLTRHLAAGLAGEVIDPPALGGGESTLGGTFTRVDLANLQGERKKPAAVAGAADIPIPNPATYWLMLFALPALLVARRRPHRESSS